MDIRFLTWNVRSLYRSGTLKTEATESTKYKIDLVGIYKRSNGTRVAVNQQKIIHLSWKFTC